MHNPSNRPSRGRLSSRLVSSVRLAVLALFVVLSMSGLALAAGAPTVTDRAGLFSSATIDEANQTIERIYKNTQKQIYVETLPSLPAGKAADTLAEERFVAHSVDGALILIVKDPHKLAVTVGRTTEARFHDAEGVRRAMLERFRRDDYDGGLLAGLRVIEPAFTQEFRPGAVAPRRAGAVSSERASVRERASESSGLGSWAWVLLLGGGGLLALLWWRRRNRGTTVSSGYGPSMTSSGPMTAGGFQPGFGQVSSGGGIGRSLLGGAAGAVAGSWLYDRFIRDHHDGEAHAATPSYDSGRDGMQDSDHGDVGSTLGGDGDGADWGGGDSTGADW